MAESTCTVQYSILATLYATGHPFPVITPALGSKPYLRLLFNFLTFSKASAGWSVCFWREPHACPSCITYHCVVIFGSTSPSLQPSAILEQELFLLLWARSKVLTEETDAHIPTRITPAVSRPLGTRIKRTSYLAPPTQWGHTLPPSYPLCPASQEAAKNVCSNWQRDELSFLEGFLAGQLALVSKLLGTCEEGEVESALAL